MRKISVVMTGRADSSPLAPLIKELSARGVLAQSMWINASSPAEATSQAQKHVAASRPDIMVILGDRWDALSAAHVATYERIPIAHIHGGEVTSGSFDNQIRNAITKLSHIHFVATIRAHRRLFGSLDERPSRVFPVSAPGLDRLVNMPPRKTEKKFVVTWHPVTLCPDETDRHLIDALTAFTDYEIVWTRPCNDPGSVRRGEMFSDAEYIRHCRAAAAIIGNSSSGVIEAPYMEVPSVNIGNRQAGREMGPSVFSCRCHSASITAKICKAIEHNGPFDSPYGGPGASAKIADILMNISLEGILAK